MNQFLLDLYPAKATFAPGEAVVLKVFLQNPHAVSAAVHLCCTVFDEDRPCLEIRSVQALEPQSQTECLLALPPLPDDRVTHRGYGARLTGTLRNAVEGVTKEPACGIGPGAGIPASGTSTADATECIATAFDVSDDWRHAPRYGFLSDFGPDDGQDADDVDFLLQCHISLVQFYDWMFRHDDLLPPSDRFQDLMGRTLSRTAVQHRIAACRDAGMRTMAYGAIYAASGDFFARHPDWGLYAGNGRPYDFIGIFHIMNTAPDSPWSAHIVEEYRKAVVDFGFDGIHMDTYGYPKFGFSRLGGVVREERLERHFPALIDRARTVLSADRPDAGLVFNNVGNWPVPAVAASSVDALYVEVWAPYTRYAHLADIVRQARLIGRHKPIILAAYLKPFAVEDAHLLVGKKDTEADNHLLPGKVADGTASGWNGVPNGDTDTSAFTAAEWATLLANAAITALGAQHLFLGARRGILTEGYYPNHARIRDAFLPRIRRTCDFQVRYGHLLFDPALEDVSMTHAYGDNEEYVFSGAPTSACGEPGHVWTILREKPGLKLISLINLLGVADDRWNAGKSAPTPAAAFSLRVQVPSRPARAYRCSPDDARPDAFPLAFDVEETDRGSVLRIELQEVRLWTMVVLAWDAP